MPTPDVPPPRVVEFFVPGRSAPKGSTGSFRSASTGRIVTLTDSKHLPLWAASVRLAAFQHWGRPPAEKGIAIRLDLRFIVARPKYHYGTGQNAGRVKKSYLAILPTGDPDRDKLLRAIQDALEGVVYRNDSQVTHGPTCKMYGPEPGVHIRISYAKDTVTGE